MDRTGQDIACAPAVLLQPIAVLSPSFASYEAVCAAYFCFLVCFCTVLQLCLSTRPAFCLWPSALTRLAGPSFLSFFSFFCLVLREFPEFLAAWAPARFAPCLPLGHAGRGKEWAGAAYGAQQLPFCQSEARNAQVLLSHTHPYVHTSHTNPPIRRLFPPDQPTPSARLPPTTAAATTAAASARQPARGSQRGTSQAPMCGRMMGRRHFWSPSIFWPSMPVGQSRWLHFLLLRFDAVVGHEDLEITWICRSEKLAIDH